MKMKKKSKQMNTIHSSRISMNYVLLLFLQDNEETVNRVPFFRKLADQLRLNISAITEQVGFITVKNNGLGRLKKEKKARLLIETQRYCHLLRRFAASNKLEQLRLHMEFNIPKLQSMGVHKLISFCKLIITMLGLHSNSLPARSFNTRKLADYRELVNDAAIFLKTKQPDAALRRVAGSKLINLLKENKYLVERKMTPAVRLFLRNHPAFYHGFMKCSIVRSPVISHTRVLGTVQDKYTGHGVAGVSVKVLGTDCQVSSRKTGYRLMIPDKGRYTIVFEKPGYKKVTRRNVNVKLGETVTLNLQIMPEG